MIQSGRIRQSKAIRESFREMMKNVATSSPGYILAFDPVTQLAQVQIGITRVDINGATFAPPTIIETPVYFPGGDYHIEYQIDPGCEGDILFSQRCVDGWLQTGGVAANPIGRFHDLQDAFFLPGFRSMPNKLPAFQNNGIRLSNHAGTQFMWLKNDGTIEVNSSSKVTITAPAISAVGTVSVSTGATGSFTTPTGDTVFVQDGIIINIF